MLNKVGIDEKGMEQILKTYQDAIFAINKRLEDFKNSGKNETDPEYQKLLQDMMELYISAIIPMAGFLIHLMETQNSIAKQQADNIVLLAKSSERLNKLTYALIAVTIALLFTAIISIFH